MKSYQYIVVGLGGIGSAVLGHLSRRSKNVLGIDQFIPPHDRGSSFGGTRMTRLANGEGDWHSRLSLRAYELWEELERLTGRRMLTKCGGIMFSGDGSARFNDTEDYFSRTVVQAETHRIPHEILTAQEARTRFPQFKVGAGERAYFEPQAGFLDPESCITGQLELACSQGASLLSNCEVTHLEEMPAGGVRAHTSQGVMEAEQVILCAGPWVGQFLKEGFPHLFQTIRQITFWFDVEDISLFQPGKFPVYIWGPRDGRSGHYGFPAVDGRGGGFKVASEGIARPEAMEGFDRTVSDDEITEMYERYLLPSIEGVKPHCLRAKTCVFTTTPDHGFVIDRHPGMPSVILASPCSGIGFKYASALGEIIAGLALGDPVDTGLLSWGLNRF